MSASDAACMTSRWICSLLVPRSCKRWRRPWMLMTWRGVSPRNVRTVRAMLAMPDSPASPSRSTARTARRGRAGFPGAASQHTFQGSPRSSDHRQEAAAPPGDAGRRSCPAALAKMGSAARVPNRCATLRGHYDLRSVSGSRSIDHTISLSPCKVSHRLCTGASHRLIWLIVSGRRSKRSGPYQQ